MRLLADTHIFVWLFSGNPLLRSGVRERMDDKSNELFISAASVWEAEIKKAKGKLLWPDDALGRLAAAGITVLDILAEDTVAAARLPQHHGDPFDRMIVAHVMRHTLTLVTYDRIMEKYLIPILNA